MAAKKRRVKQEPLLNTVARKLGHAAGALTKATHEFTENLSALPENLSTKVLKAANIGKAKNRPARFKKSTRRAASGSHPKRVVRGSKAKGVPNPRQGRKRTNNP